MGNNINWDELKKKVDADLQKDIDAEIKISKKDNDNNYFSCHLSPREVDLDPFNLWGKVEVEVDEEDDDKEYPDDEDDFEPEDSEEDEYLDDNDDQDYGDQGGFLSESPTKDADQKTIEAYAWNKNKKEAEETKQPNKNDIQCIHLFKNLDSYNDSVYIYPLTPEQDICLCKECNMTLASKIMEQMALELFL